MVAAAAVGVGAVGVGAAAVGAVGAAAAAAAAAALTPPPPPPALTPPPPPPALTPTSGMHAHPGALAAAGRVAALGDFNADRAPDLLLLAPDQRSLSLLLWDAAAAAFAPAAGAPLVLRDPARSPPLTIAAAVAADFDRDGALDVVLFGRRSPSDSVLAFMLFRGNGSAAFAPVPSSWSSSEPAHPFVIDYDADMAPSLLGHRSGAPRDLALWTYNASAAAFDVRRPRFADSMPTDSRCSLPHPHSSAFVDLDGDCLADIFLHCSDASNKQWYQIWTNTKRFANSSTGGFALARQEPLPPDMGHISFADMDADGTVDLVFSRSPPGKPSAIFVAYNRQIGICADAHAPPGCRDPHNLCVADPGFGFNVSSTVPGAVVRININDILPDESIITRDQFFQGILPVPLRIGDYNNDGYPDILLITSSTKTRSSIVRLLKSVPCSSDKCGPEATHSGARYFVPVINGMPSSLAPDTVINTGFIDLAEDGTLDIFLALRRPDQSIYTTLFINNFYNDAFFLKSLVLNGVCEAGCPGDTPYPDPRPYGVNYAGATLKYTVLSTDGRRRATQVAQLPQSAYMPLHAPNVHIGLGRTNNYLEDLFVGVTRRRDRHVASYQGVIPNSQLVIIPYEPDPDSTPDAWKLELYMNPSSTSTALLAVLGTALALLAMVIWALDWIEKREDEIERRRVLHEINYDAM